MEHTLREIMPALILATIGASVYFFTQIMTSYILKKKMIEKGFVNDDTQAIFKQHVEDSSASSLKWGLILLFIGFSLILLEYIPINADSPLPYGLIAVSVSVGFLLNYFITKRKD